VTNTKQIRAEKIAIQLFEAIEKNKLMIPGKSEEQLASEDFDPASEKFHISDHWHRLVQSNSLFLLSLLK
jgi:hypothetical protein